MADDLDPHDKAETSEAGKASQETGNVTAPKPEKVTKLVTDPGTLMGGAPAMPEVQQHAVDAAREERARQDAPPPTSSGGTSSAGPVKGKTDFKGRAFDPALHEVDADGKPAINRDGYLKCYRGKHGSTTSHTEAQRPTPRSKCEPVAKASPGAVPVPGPDVEAQIDASAAAFSGLFVTGSVLIGGEEFAPEPGEGEALKESFAQYFRAKGVVDLPPGVVLGGAMVCYIAKRWNAPKFTARREGWIEKGKRWFHDWRYRRQLQREKVDELAKR